jgi:hypothetical protein
MRSRCWQPGIPLRLRRRPVSFFCCPLQGVITGAWKEYWLPKIVRAVWAQLEKPKLSWCEILHRSIFRRNVELLSGRSPLSHIRLTCFFLVATACWTSGLSTTKTVLYCCAVIDLIPQVMGSLHDDSKTDKGCDVNVCRIPSIRGCRGLFNMFDGCVSHITAPKPLQRAP